MNKLGENYKNTFSKICPSNESIERALNVIKENKESKKIKIAPVIAAVACFAVVITGVLGGSAISTRLNSVGTSNVQTSDSKLLKLTDGAVIIAYAEDNKIEAKELELGVNVPLQYKFTITDVRGKSDKEKEEIIENERKINKSMMDSDFKDDVYVARSGVEALDNVIIRRFVLNSFAIQANNPDNIESVNIKCNTDYWELSYYDYRDVEPENKFTIGTNLTISGDVLDGIIKHISSEEINNNFIQINLRHSIDMCSSIDKNPNIDLSNFDDTLTFTVNYKDNTKAVSVIEIGFDDEGNLHAKAVKSVHEKA